MDTDLTNNTRHLFWTGGWDSTFRLLQLLVKEESIVQPHYILKRNIELSAESTPEGVYEWSIFYFFRRNFDIDVSELSETDAEKFKLTYTVFKYFDFPLLEITKSKMYSISRRNGWMPVMKETWFCLHPLNLPLYGTVPCGKCYTCNFTKESGMGWRIPFASRAAQKLAAIKRVLIRNSTVF